MAEIYKCRCGGEMTLENGTLKCKKCHRMRKLEPNTAPKDSQKIIKRETNKNNDEILVF